MESSETIDDICTVFSSNSKSDVDKIGMKTTFNITENILEIIIPYKELSQIPDGSILGLMINSKHGAMYIDVENNLKKRFSVSFSGESYYISEKDAQLKVRRKPSEKTTLEGEKILSFKGKRFEIIGTLYKGKKSHELIVKSFYLENEDTKEKIFFKDFKVNDHKGKFNIVINLSEQPLYEGEWNLFSLVNVMDHDEIIEVIFGNEQPILQGDYLEYNNSLYYYEIFESKRAQVTLHIKKNKQSFVSWDIRKADISGNSLTIQGFFQYLILSSSEDKISNFVLMNRVSMEKIEVPISLQNNGSFFIEVPLHKQDNFFKINGIWDAFVSIQISGISELIRLNLSNIQKDEDFLSLSKPIYQSESGIIKNVRSYLTLHENLAFNVTDQILISDISRVDLELGKTILNGFMINEYLDFIPKEIFLQSIKGEEQIKCINDFRKENDLFYFRTEIDWSILNPNEIQENGYQFMITIIVKGKEYLIELVSNFDDIENKSKILIYPPLRIDMNGLPLNVRHFYNRRNALFVSLENAFSPYCTEIKKKQNERILEISIALEQMPVHSQRVELVLKSRASDKTIRIKQGNNTDNDHYTFRIKDLFFNEEDIFSGTFDVFCDIYANGQLVTARVKGDNSKLLEANSIFKNNAIRMSKDLFFSIYFDQKTSNLNLELRELRAIEKKGERIKFFIAKILAKFSRNFVKKPVWLIGENLGEIAQDNGFAFFQYCIENKSGETYYYVSKKDNKNMGNLIPYKDNVLEYDSFKHYYLYWLCQFLIVSHGIRDVIPSIVHNKMNNNPKRMIYLQHGIIAMKKLKFNKDSYNGKIRKFVVSSVHEKNILIKKMNFKPKQIMVTGLSRFDTLIDKSKGKEIKEILLIPTWREWLITSETEFLNSDFYLQYIALLRDPNLHELLERHNLILKFFPHIEIQRKYLDHFSSLNERIKVIKIEDKTVKDLIQESSLLITDYSSVVFDFNYLRKPVLFFHFDLHDYLRHRGSYVDLGTELIGDIAETEKELLDFIKEYIDTDFEYKPLYGIKSKKYYAYRDKNNSKRIYTEIKKLN
ncbi:CDP-glycerol glycerophosphotransferase family protein [Neobacillus drentensis]|nr:CDP-glycerol glycerophosphotransferase family protein [Neobacillus drentensis]